MRTPKENKQKPRDRTLKSTAGTIPKAALKAVWLKTKEQARTAARENDTESRQQEPTDFAGSAAEQSASFVWRQGRKLAETQARQRRQKEAAARAHAAGERGVSPKQVECGTLPNAGTITSQFGYRVDPITGEVSSHTGTDIACAEGAPILAAADGIVTVANGLDNWGGSYGYYIQIDHGGGMETLYAHCSSICVTTGQQVQAGQVIGYVGHTGRVTGNHLHLEVRIDGNRADAMQFFTL